MLSVRGSIFTFGVVGFMTISFSFFQVFGIICNVWSAYYYVVGWMGMRMGLGILLGLGGGWGFGGIYGQGKSIWGI